MNKYLWIISSLSLLILASGCGSAPSASITAGSASISSPPSIVSPATCDYAVTQFLDEINGNVATSTPEAAVFDTLATTGNSTPNSTEIDGSNPAIHYDIFDVTVTAGICATFKVTIQSGIYQGYVETLNYSGYQYSTTPGSP